MARIFDSMRSTPWAHAAISHNSAAGPIDRNTCSNTEPARGFGVAGVPSGFCGWSG